MKIQTNAVNILERTSSYLQAGLLRKTPAWYNVVADIQPVKKFNREPIFKNPSNGRDRTEFRPFSENVNSKGLYKTRYNVVDKKTVTNKLYKPPKLIYLEDKLRQLFYEQHPWEMSRPKVVVENEMDVKYDWSHILQLGKPLDGESVVQRSLYLVKNKQFDNIIDSYNHARFEFYRIRMQQELDEQIAQEEAEMFGSVFESSALQYGIEQEQRVIDQWKKKAIKETEISAAKRVNPSESWGKEDAEEQDGVSADEEIEELHL
ncbi:similar to Saccharomyces cerevisiae YIL093C RSM25 Mitochondrial ribosomal protein of the small subunit [Maudiozyma saulgeensis]|uniref:37S ribosomal protein S25, mitochondrial n=1 Tax=Maudiozyma saulgeensis TaxID=1789683 RepID=A0A1X7R0I5_9SACH|nr:similar to Saccharomyces cerevisiae YIL093C RSM25 Mitochondrial ribosomal protein of the small subunit [Kazachstania saulgeensis]